MATFHDSCIALEAANSNQKLNTENLIPHVYLNCGCWHGAHTDFALVSEGTIVCGTWRNYHGEAGVWNPAFKSQQVQALLKDVDAPKIKAFFNNAPADEDGVPLGYPIADKILSIPWFKFTDPGELLVFLGDCHIQLFREWLNDGFVRPKVIGTANVPSSGPDSILGLAKAPESVNYYVQRSSLAGDLRTFVEYASASAGSSKLIQVGDLLEIWEVQWIYEVAFKTYCELVKGLSPDPETGQPHPGDSWQLRRFPRELLARSGDYQQLAAQDCKLPGSGWFNFSASSYPDTEHRRKLPRYFGFTPADSPEQLEIAQAKWRSQVPPLDALTLVLYRWADNLSDYASPFDLTTQAIFNSWLRGDPVTFPPDAPLKTMNEVIAQFKAPIVQGDGHLPLDFTDYQAVEERIRKRYSELASVFPLFVEGNNFVRGNHDTGVTNEYLKAKFKADSNVSWDLDDEISEFEGSKGFDDPEASLADTKYTLRKGGTCKGSSQGKICVEHGHAFDLFNSNRNFFRWDVKGFMNAGYHSARDWFFKGKLTDPATYFMRYLGLRGDEDLEKFAKERAQMIIDKHKADIRLVVLGHTHVLDLSVMTPGGSK